MKSLLTKISVILIVALTLGLLGNLIIIHPFHRSFKTPATDNPNTCFTEEAILPTCKYDTITYNLYFRGAPFHNTAGNVTTTSETEPIYYPTYPHQTTGVLDSVFGTNITIPIPQWLANTTLWTLLIGGLWMLTSLCKLLLRKIKR